MGVEVYLSMHLSVSVSVQLCFICIHVCPHTNLHKHASHVCIYVPYLCQVCASECALWLTECVCSKCVDVKAYPTCVSHVYPKYTGHMSECVHHM